MANNDLRPSLERAANRQRILSALLRAGTTTRVEMAERTGLSRPTVNAIVAELVDEGLVAAAGNSTGGTGRAAVMYHAVPTARTVVGIDLGGTKIVAGVADVTGALIGTKTIPARTDEPGIAQRIDQLCRQLMQETGLSIESLASVSIGAPGVPHPVTHRMQFASYIPELGEIDLRYELSELLGLPVTLDNDVNMAMVGERWKGRAQHARNAVFIVVGSGIGMGIIAGGRLQRGFSGAAGEIGFLPIAWDPFDGRPRTIGGVEDQISSIGILRSYERFRAEDGGEALSDARAVFAAAAAGEPSALRAVDHAAKQLALVVSAVQAVLDPERVIFGGSIGTNELMVTLLRQYLDRLGRRPPVVETSALGDQATLLGAIAVSLQHAQLSVGIDPEFVVG